MNEHTPGPWHWDDGEDEDMPKLMAPSGEVCNFGNCEQYYPTEGLPPNAADACLIAAAPELLEALLWAMVFVPRPIAGMASQVHNEHSSMFHAAMAAIAKATGSTA